MSKVYGYCRVSTKKQSIDRQESNIKNYDNNVLIVKEQYTGTKLEGRDKFIKLVGKFEEVEVEGVKKEILKGGIVKEGDTIIFDSVSRMSRNAEEGFRLYQELFNKGIELVFLKEQHINTETYKKALTNNIELTGTNLDFILEGINKYLLSLAREQIIIAFEQSEKEVKDLQQRTKEGIRAKREQAIAEGREFKIGIEEGRKLITKKSIEMKEKIKKYSKDFNGSLTDKDTMELLKISRNTYYKYKRELLKGVQ